MASLLAIFILVLVVALVELEKRKEELRLSKEELIEGLESVKQIQDGIAGALSGVVTREHSLASMLTEIQKNLQTQGIEITIAENGSVLRIPEHQLHFELGKYNIPETYAKHANAIGKVILQSLRSDENRAMLDTVFIEGHTDSVTNFKEMGNWGLSTYRAISLWYFWTESPGFLAELKQLKTIPADQGQPPKPLISVSGYADTRSTHGSLDAITIKEDRPEDRRIDIRFTLISKEKTHLGNLHKNLKQMQTKMQKIIDQLKAGNNAH